MALSAAPTVEVVALSDISNLMAAGTYLKDLKSSTGITMTRLLIAYPSLLCTQFVLKRRNSILPSIIILWEVHRSSPLRMGF